MNWIEYAEEAPSPVIPHTSEIIVGVIFFAILLFLITKKVVPRFESTYQARTEAIQGGIEKAEKAQQEAARALAQYQAQLASVRDEASKIREDARLQGVAIVEELRTKAQEESERLIQSAHVAIQTERDQAIASLRSEVGGLAVDLASKIVGESLEDQARQSRIVDRFLSEQEKK